MEKFMNMAVKAAQDNVTTNSGGPFGAVVVKDGKVIGVGRNQVTSLNDPTAHAEVQAIREACQPYRHSSLRTARSIPVVNLVRCASELFFGHGQKRSIMSYTKEDAAKIGFDDQFIYEQIALPANKRSIKMIQLTLEQADLPFQNWAHSSQKISY